jgi:hypothetical protein
MHEVEVVILTFLKMHEVEVVVLTFQKIHEVEVVVDYPDLLNNT